jgi:hypothetical protein
LDNSPTEVIVAFWLVWINALYQAFYATMIVFDSLFTFDPNPNPTINPSQNGKSNDRPKSNDRLKVTPSCQWPTDA